VQEERRLEEVDDAMDALEEEMRYLDTQVRRPSLGTPPVMATREGGTFRSTGRKGRLSNIGVGDCTWRGLKDAMLFLYIGTAPRALVPLLSSPFYSRH
jgi:hypothetical protein